MKLGNVLIIGDSYSTFEGYIAEGCAPYYGRSERKPESDVSAVEETWWHRLIAENDANLLLNSSYSGTTINNATNLRSTGYYSGYSSIKQKYYCSGSSWKCLCFY